MKALSQTRRKGRANLSKIPEGLSMVKSCSIQGFNPEQKTKRINEDKLK